MRKNNLTGTITLTILAIKRDRYRLIAWIVGIALITGFMCAAISKMLPADEDVVNMISAHASYPVMRIFLGPSSGLEMGSFFMFRFSTIIAVIIAFFGILTISRHTRQNEETGCDELIRTTKVGHHSGLMAALIVSILYCLLLALLLSLAFILNGFSIIGSIAAGLALSSVGIFFSGITAITAQLSSTTRGANGIAGLIVGISFLVSGLGNMMGDYNPDTYIIVSKWPVWLSPFGWYQQIYSFSENNYWILSLFLVTLIGLSLIGFYLKSQRDLGRGILPVKKGPSKASCFLLSSVGLSFRLQRKLILIWGMSTLIFGAILGAAVSELIEEMSELERAEHIFGDIFQMSETFAIGLTSLLSTFVVILVTQSFIRMVNEEQEGLTEPILATTVSPIKWIVSHIICIVVGLVITLLLLGLGGASSALVDSSIRWYKVVQSAIIQIPAFLILIGIDIMIFGLYPRYSIVLPWSVLIFCLLTGPFLGPALNLPIWLQNISPFTHIPSPTDTISFAPLIIMTVLSILLASIGIISFHYRRIRSYKK